MELLIDILFGVFFFGVIFTTSFLFRRKPVPYYFFIAGYIIFLFSLFNNLIVANGMMLKWPHLFRVMSPFQFLLAPLSFLFCRSMLRPYQKLGWKDGLHAIPFIISFIGLLPLYLLSADEKRELINLTSTYTGLTNIADSFGLPFYLTLRIKFGFFLIYMAYQWKMLIQFRKNATEGLKKKNRLLLIWITFDSFFKTFFGLTIFLSAWMTGNIQAAAILQVCLVSFELLTSASFILFSPELLLGLKFLNTETQTKAFLADRHLESPLVGISSEKSLPTDEQQLLTSIEEYFQLEQPYLNPDFSLSDLSKALSIPQRQISNAIKAQLGQSFPEYINQVRFGYMESLIQQKPEVKQFSIDAIAKMAGFNSRSGFYKAFKKLDKYENPAQMLDFLTNRK